MTTDPLSLRFDGVRRLYGNRALGQFAEAHVLVVGLGGVGSWAVEALARTGVGALTLVDFDDVCISNTNRQIHALQGEVGRPKVKALQDRIFKINPDCKVRVVQDFYSADQDENLFRQPFDCVLDAIDKTLNKEELALACRENRTPLVVVGSAGGLRDPSLVRVKDLSQTLEDTMLSNMRKTLRRRHGFPRGKEKFAIPAVFSMEKPAYVNGDGCVTFERPPELKGALDCAGGLGSSMAVTTTFAMFAVSEVLKIVEKNGRAYL